MVEADESDRSLLKLAPADRRRSPTPSSTTTRPTPRSATSTTRSARSSALAEQPRSSGTARSCSRSPADVPVVAVRRPTPSSTAGGSRFTLDGVDVDAHRPRRPQRPQRRGRADARRGSPARTCARPPPRCATSRAPAGASSGSGTTAAGALRRRRLRAPPDRGRARRSRPPARSAPRRVVAVFQPHLYSRTQHAGDASSAPALAGGRRGRRARRLPGARARGGLPGRHRPAGRRGGRRRRRRASGGLDAARTPAPSRYLRGDCARATCC